MKTYKSLLEDISSILSEVKSERVHIIGNELWVAYAEGSGTTARLITPKSYLTNKKDDDHYDSIVDKIFDWSKTNAPVKKGKKGSLYKIGVYKNTKQAWNEPDSAESYMWMTVSNDTEKHKIIHLFNSKNEAMHWI